MIKIVYFSRASESIKTLEVDDDVIPATDDFAEAAYHAQKIVYETETDINIKKVLWIGIDIKTLEDNPDYMDF